MSADFSHYTNYKEDTSFSKVVFGSSAPVLEVEMNELQEIVDTKLKALHSIVGKCAFVQGAITLTNVSGSIYNVTVTNCTLIDKGFTAYVDTITSSNTTISSGANVYFMLTKERVTGADTLRKYGNTTGTTITNEICDSRIGAETTQREQIQVSLHITTGNVPNDTAITVYLPIGTIFNGVFTENETVFSETMVDSINMLGTYKLNTSDFTADNITGVLPISKGGTNVATLTDLKNLIGGTIRHGICTTASDVQEKVVDLGGFPAGVSLSGIPYDNEVFFVTFTNTNTFSVTTENLLILRVNRHEGENTFYQSAQLFPRDVNISAGYTYAIKYTPTINGGFSVLGAFRNGGIIPIEEGGTGGSDKYTAYKNLIYNKCLSDGNGNYYIEGQSGTTITTLDDIVYSGLFHIYSIDNTSTMYNSLPIKAFGAYIYTFSPTSTGNMLMQVYIPIPPTYDTNSPAMAIRTATSGGSGITFSSWIYVPTETLLGFKNKSSIEIVYSNSNNQYVYRVIVDESTIGSNPASVLNFTWSYKTVNGSTIVEDWTDVTPTTESGTKYFLANNSSSPTITKIYVKSKVIDNITYEVQTKEFEISVPSQYQN